MTTGVRGAPPHVVSWSGEDSPDPLARRENIFEKTWIDDSLPTGQYGYINSNGNWVWGGTGSLADFTSNPNVWFMGDAQTLNLQNRLLSNIKGYGLNMAVSAAEGKESLGMIKDTSLSLFRAYRDVRKGRIGDAWKSIRDGNLRNGRRFARRPKKIAYTLDASSAWLSFRYGWQPLLKDIYSALSFIENRAKVSEENYTRIRASVKETMDLSSSSPVGYFSSVTNRYTALAKVNTKWLTSFLTLQASGVMDPELVAWEVLPYSFVVDWFLPIGTYLESRSAIPRLSVSYILGKKSEGFALGPWSGSGIPRFEIYTVPLGVSIHGSFQRQITSWPTPLPSFRNPFAQVKHVVDALGLWSQKGLR